MSHMLSHVPVDPDRNVHILDSIRCAMSQSSDYYDNDPELLAVLQNIELPGDNGSLPTPNAINHEPPPSTQPSLKRKYVPDEDDDDDALEPPSEDIYGAAVFGGFGQYMRRKRAKLQIQNAEIVEAPKSRIFNGLAIYVCLLGEFCAPQNRPDTRL